MAASRRPSVFLFSCRVAYLGSAATKVEGHRGGGISDRDSAFGALQEPLTALYDGDAGVGVARAPRGAFVTVFSTGLQLEVTSGNDQTSRVFFWFSVDRLLLAAAVKRTATAAVAAKAKSGSWRRPRGLRRRLDDAPAFAAVDAPESTASRHPALLALLVAGCDEDVMTMTTATSAETKRRGLTRWRRNARSPPPPAPQCHGLVLASETQARLLEAACRFALAHRNALADEVHVLWQEAVSGLASAGATASSSSASSSPLVGAPGLSTRAGERSDAFLASEASDASLSDSSSGDGHPGCGDGAATQLPHPTHWSLADEYVPSVRIRAKHFDAATFDGYRKAGAERRPLRGWSSEYGGDGTVDCQWPSALRRNDRRQERPPEADGWQSGSRRMDVPSVRSTGRAEATVAMTAAPSARWRNSRYSAYIDDDEDEGFRLSSDVRRRRARSEAGDSGRHQRRHQHRAPSIESPRRQAEAGAAAEAEALFVNAAANGVAMGFVTGDGMPRVAQVRQPASGGDGGHERRHDRPFRGDRVASSRPVSEAGRRSTLAAPAQAASEPVLAARRRPGTPPADYYDENPVAVVEHRPPPPPRAERGSLRRTALDVRSSSYGFGQAESEAASERFAAISNGGQRPCEPPPAPPLLPPPSIRGTASKLAIGATPPPPPPPPPPPNAGVPDHERELTEQRNELMRSIRERVRERASVARPQATE